MQSLATVLFGFGLVITCLAGYRVLLLGVDLLTKTRSRPQLRAADRILIGLSLLGVALLAIGALLLHGTTHAG